MPTPVLFNAGGADPFASVAPADRSTSVEVFIATNRKPAGKPDPRRAATAFTGALSRSLRLGAVNVSMGGPDMDWSQLCEQSLLAKRARNPVVQVRGAEDFGALWTTAADFDPADHREPSEAQRAPAEAFTRRINQALARSNRKDIFIFVHGFNTALAGNVAVTAEFWHYLGRPGVCLTFAWPSKDSIFAYEKDKVMADDSIRNFRLLLDYLIESTDVERINILAHSAGAPIVIHGLTHLRLMHAREDRASLLKSLRIGQVVLAAPDVDLVQFVNDALDGFANATGQTTIYMSTTDEALSFSSLIWGMARLGSAIDALEPEDLNALKQSEDMVAVDVAAAQKVHGGGFGHSYFRTDIWVSADVILTLRFGLTPEQRGLVLGNSDVLWDFPDDYPQRVREIGARLYGEEEKASRGSSRPQFDDAPPLALMP